MVQRLRPSGAGEHASAIKRASKRPSKRSLQGVVRLAGPKAASKPSSTKRRLRRSTVRSQMPSASAMSATLHRSPQWGPTSHNKSARACTNLWADVFPVRVSDSSLSRSSFVSVTLYRGTILYHRTELGFRIRHPLRYCLLGRAQSPERYTPARCPQTRVP